MRKATRRKGQSPAKIARRMELTEQMCEDDGKLYDILEGLAALVGKRNRQLRELRDLPDSGNDACG
jgi:hypothetical protein